MVQRKKYRDYTEDEKRISMMYQTFLRLSDPEKHKTKMRKYNKTSKANDSHPDLENLCGNMKEYKRAYYLKNRDKYLARDKEYFKKKTYGETSSLVELTRQLHKELLCLEKQHREKCLKKLS